ncbi:peptide deformylase [Candidatus Uzinura diaspidicola str. ASNER]|uniref:Peptide deformylase n=1 Tax=Candidatus Uzinura diaspidicola str. ASNER TaxID=1133592 RepID=L7VG53_9FLAO|nr:peptide deformylase [Candidatus Uzinura diaspidicola str. ASNER]
MILPIRIYGDPILRKDCKDTDVSDSTIYHFINDMFDTMYQSYAVGLAAPQVGKPLRFFIIDTDTFIIDKEENKSKRVFINPEIVKIYGKTWIIKEGCLSFPDIIAKIERYESLLIRYYNESLEKCEETFQGLAARVIQHEYDHIEGKLFIDYLSLFKREKLNKKSGTL